MDIQFLEQKIDLVVSRLQNFSFRKNQKEIILQILKAQFIDNKKIFVLEAPTGSGKSIISLIFSLVNKELSNTGYILTSDLMLQDQYVRDIEKYNLNIASVKGVDNYNCLVNGQKFSLGECRKTRKPAKTMECYSDCAYYTARDKAINCEIALFNYAYFLIQRNRSRSAIFGIRDFVVCDEGHKIPNIIQSQFSPKITSKFYNVIEDVVGTLLLEEVDIILDKTIKTDIDNLLSIDKNDYENIYSLIESLLNKFRFIENKANKFSDDILPIFKESYVDFHDKLDFIRDMNAKISDYIQILNSYGKSSCVYNLNLETQELTLNCIMERSLVERYLNQKTKFQLILSATLGNLSEFSKKCSFDIHDNKLISLKSDWNFDKSPIFGFKDRKDLNMSSKFYQENLKNSINVLDQILNRHKEQRGIIHSVSFNFAKDIQKYISLENRKRLLIYSTTTEKDIQLKKLESTKNGVLIGPSLIEGLNLENDLARFCVFGKVPYPYLGDELIAKKLKFFPTEYAYETSLAIQQGVGRIIRNDEDFGITYLLDSSFHNYFKRNSFYFPKEFLNRLKFM